MKVSQFKAGRATSSLSREFTVKIARKRRYARRVHISRGRSSLCMRRSSISSVSVSSHSVTQTRVYRAAHSDFDGEMFDYWRRVHEESSPRFSSGWKRLKIF